MAEGLCHLALVARAREAHVGARRLRTFTMELPGLGHKRQIGKPMPTGTAELVLRHMRLDVPYELHLLEADGPTPRQAKEGRVHRPKIDHTKIAQDERQIAKDAQLGIGVPAPHLWEPSGRLPLAARASQGRWSLSVLGVGL